MSPPEKRDVNTRNTDQLDYAAELQEEFNNRGIEQARKALAPESHPDFDGENCVDCGNPIPPERLEMKKVRDTICQSKLELRKKLYGR